LYLLPKAMNAVIFVFQSLKDRLQSGGWNPGDRLPSLYALAKEFDVSSTVVWRAIALLKKESLVFTKKRGSIIAGPSGIGTIKQSSASYGWERLQVLIKSDLIKGLFIQETLPPLNKLALRYGVAINTIRKSIAALSSEGLLERRGRSFRQVRVHSASSRRAMVMISAGDDEHRMITADQRTQRVMEAFERECSRLDFDCRCEGFAHDRADGLMHFISVIKSIPQISGCIVSMWNPFSDLRRQRWNDLLRFLGSLNVPVVIFDQEGDLVFPPEVLAHDHMRILRLGNKRAGELVGAALMRRGAANLVYLTGYFHLPWVQQRYAGLGDYIKCHTGSDVSVKLFAPGYNLRETAIILSFLKLDKKETFQLFRERKPLADFVGLADDWDASRNITLVEPEGTLAQGPTARDIARYLLTVARKEHSSEVYNSILRSLLMVAANRGNDCFLYPIFKKALGFGLGTTWVCSDDKAAIIAMNFLTDMGVKVPAQIAVIGFENWRETADRHISSFDFNMNGMVQEAMLMIIDRKVFKSKPAISGIDGYVVERQTTRK
jgi:DNA-binding GntR family transcriptional regulator/DNA-binding LacI/PurR family transcriptional regulator